MCIRDRANANRLRLNCTGVYPGLGSSVGSMFLRRHFVRVLLPVCLLCPLLRAQVSIAGRVVDENGTAVSGALVEVRQGEFSARASSDAAGNFRTSLPGAGAYDIR